MTLYLVRHAQSLPKSSQPFSDWRLSPLGQGQAQELADLLNALEIGCIFSSPSCAVWKRPAPSPAGRAFR